MTGSLYIGIACARLARSWFEHAESAIGRDPAICGLAIERGFENLYAALYYASEARAGP